MKLQPKTKPSKRDPVFSQVRETEEAFQALAQEAQKAGITQTEALRQIIQAYLDKPFAFEGKTTGKKTHILASIAASQKMIDDFTLAMNAQGVSVGEGVRQCVRHFLRQQGRKIQ